MGKYSECLGFGRGQPEVGSHAAHVQVKLFEGEDCHPLGYLPDRVRLKVANSTTPCYQVFMTPTEFYKFVESLVDMVDSPEFQALQFKEAVK